MPNSGSGDSGASSHWDEEAPEFLCFAEDASDYPHENREELTAEELLRRSGFEFTRADWDRAGPVNQRLAWQAAKVRLWMLDIANILVKNTDADAVAMARGLLGRIVDLLKREEANRAGLDWYQGRQVALLHAHLLREPTLRAIRAAQERVHGGASEEDEAFALATTLSTLAAQRAPRTLAIERTTLGSLSRRDAESIMADALGAALKLSPREVLSGSLRVRRRG